LDQGLGQVVQQCPSLLLLKRSYPGESSRLAYTVAVIVAEFDLWNHLGISLSV
jgi:hypothetical protein